ncbi:hypothetical protein D9M68_837480 [compost metagenome]
MLLQIGGAEPDLNTAFFGKFYGIAHEVDQDLVQARRITDQPIRDIGGNVQIERQVFFLCFQDHHFLGALYQFFHREIDLLDLNFISFDLGQIQDIVDDNQQVICTLLNDVQVFFLFI